MIITDLHKNSKVKTNTGEFLKNQKKKGAIRDKEGNLNPEFQYDMLSPELDTSRYVETVTDSDGTVTHIFKPVTKKLEIVCVEEKGKPIKPLAK